ncbi:MAG: hypothetical protein ABJN62_18690 [Halioglobus sp.]
MHRDKGHGYTNVNPREAKRRESKNDSGNVQTSLTGLPMEELEKMAAPDADGNVNTNAAKALRFKRQQRASLQSIADNDRFHLLTSQGASRILSAGEQSELADLRLKVQGADYVEAQNNLETAFKERGVTGYIAQRRKMRGRGHNF